MSSPSSPCGSEDFAAFLDSELQSASSNANSDSEEQSDQEPTIIGKKRKRLENEAVEFNTRVEDSSSGPIPDQQEGDKISKICPPHPGYIWDVCIRCAAHKSAEDHVNEVGVALRYIYKGLEVSRVEAERIRCNELERVLSKKKLHLVLDIDHTLLNSARFIELTEDEYEYLNSVYCTNEDTTLSENVKGSGAPDGTERQQKIKASGLYELKNLHMWTKLRPFVHRFLEAASDMFDMYLYTMGERVYADAMACLLDPKGRFFKNRVICQSDSTCRTTKDLDIVLGVESATIILDDTEAVWPKHRANLVVMERYHFFASSCKQFGIFNASLVEAEKDECEENGILANTLHLLQQVHTAYFDGRYKDEKGELHTYSGEQDVREIMRSIKSRILSGCKIIFSRIFPTSLISPESHPCWRLAEEMGAICATKVDATVTHVVALDPGTDKAKWAIQNDRHLVHPRWIDAAFYNWRKPNEIDYSIAEAAFLTTYAKTVKRDRLITEPNLT